jgi:beta-fructofuranosidase
MNSKTQPAKAGAAATRRIMSAATFALMFLACQSDLPQGRGEEPLADRRSRAPRYTFANTLEAQLEQLKDNPTLKRMKESRVEQAKNPWRPIYHFIHPEGRLHDPNGLCYWQGRWHLFYQAHPPEDERNHWGHAVSDDLVHWRDLPLAIYPDPELKCYSGACYVEDDRVIAMYHGPGAGTMVAVSSDPLLLNWEKLAGGPVIKEPQPGDPPTAYAVYDPNIWKQGGMYYALTGSAAKSGPAGKRMRVNYLFRSKDLTHWDYLHPFAEDDAYGLVGDDGACPYFWPIGDQSDPQKKRHILLHFSHRRGGKYIIGKYDVNRQKFVVTNGGDFNHGPVFPGGVHAPTAFPDGHGRVIAMFNMNPGTDDKYLELVTLPWQLTLLDEDRLGIEPVPALNTLRGRHTHIGETHLPANEEVVLPGVEGKSMELGAEIAVPAESSVELKVLRSPNQKEFTRILFQRGAGYRNADYQTKGPQLGAITLDTSNASTLPNVMPRAPETASVEVADDEPLRLRIFIDRSVVEVFANGRQVVAQRVYPSRDDSVGVSIQARGKEARLVSIDAWQMKSIYP